MAVAVTLAVSPPAPAHGQTVTATYTVTGNEGSPSQVGTVSGEADIGGQHYDVFATITQPGTPPLAEAFTVPVCPGLTFTATGDPHVFTAVVP